MPARDYYLALPGKDQAKILPLFQIFANRGLIQNGEKFKKLGSKAKGKGSELWEFKSFQHRFLCDYRQNGRFIIAIIAYALQKKRDNLPKPDIEKAVRILQENDQREEGDPMNRPSTDYELFEQSSDDNRRLLREEALILEVTEAVSAVMQEEGVSKTQLAKRLGKTKGFISQLLSGGRNLTLRTLAGLVEALGYRVTITVSKDRDRMSVSSASPDLRVSNIESWSAPWAQSLTRRESDFSVSLRDSVGEYGAAA